MNALAWRSERELACVAKPVPSISAGELLLAVHASALTSADVDSAAPGQTSGSIVCGSVVSGGRSDADATAEFEVGERVIAVVPAAAGGGAAEFAVVSVSCAVRVPSGIEASQLVARLAAGLLSFVALHVQNDCLLPWLTIIFETSSVFLVGIHCWLPMLRRLQPAGLVALQLVNRCDSSAVFAAVQPADEADSERCRALIASASNQEARMIDLRVEQLATTVLDETDGIGVDCVIDLNGTEAKPASESTAQREVIDSIGVLGRWAVQSDRFQLDPPASRVLHTKGISISFLSDGAFRAGAHNGKLKHVIWELLNTIDNEAATSSTVSFSLIEAKQVSEAVNSRLFPVVVVPSL
eukprot:TRINITY_DN670_c0_g1_i1.p1 TRINITY_DN670_c0_g1~~TRINITY_DN670_c0_g1_i1.p1  ORF type:complete len:354 (-),score=37.12 TRINITY_DN670_c0_g1_i1:58-1119(-)